MLSRLSKRAVPGRLADVLLWSVLVLAPVAGGSTHVLMLPLLATLSAGAAGAVLWSHRRQGRSVRVAPLSIGLVLLAAYTLLQFVPLPRAWVLALSPTVVELRTFVEGTERAYLPLSYEPGATLREAAKLLVYALVAWVARERARAHDDLRVVSVGVALAGLATAIVGLVNRTLGLERIMGILPTMQSADELLTTFPNPNHAAGFMALCCLTSIGLSLDAKTRSFRVGFGAVAALTGLLNVLSLSRGGVAALCGGLALLAVLGGWMVRRRDAETPVGMATAILIAAPLVALVWNGDALLRELLDSHGRILGLEEKLAALRDAKLLVAEHLAAGIGRGAYVAAYPRYKTSDLQLLFAYPENIGVQLIAEWGVVVGALALLALVYAVVVRVGRASTLAGLGASLGVLALLVQNLVDFSLEVPGVAISVVALLAAQPVSPRALRFELGRAREAAPTRLRVALAPIALVVLVAWAAFALPDLRRDLRGLDRRIHDVDAAGIDPEEAEQMIAAHPVSFELTSRLTYLATTREPLQLEAAQRWANRTLYLAPSYADGHLQLARLLLLTRHREQGLDALRRAWSLIRLDRRGMVGEFALRVVEDAEELRRVVPRRNEELDLLDERFVADATRLALSRDHADWVEALFRGASPGGVPAASLEPWTQAALAAGKAELARDGARRLAELEPDSDDAVVLESRALTALEQPEAAAEVVDRAIAGRKQVSRNLVRFRLEMAIQASDPRAQDLLDRLEHLSTSARADVIDVARHRALWAQKRGRFVEAVQVLDRVVALVPSDLGVRLHRAALLRSVGRKVDARRDLEFILTREPANVAARRLLDRLDTEAPQSSLELRAMGRAGTRLREGLHLEDPQAPDGEPGELGSGDARGLGP